MTDKSTEIYFGEILKVCGHEMVTKNSRDIRGPTLAIVLERLKPYGAFHDTYESARTISTRPSSIGGSKIGKANGYASVSKHGSRAVSSSDLMKYFREDLYRRLLSTDFKKQVDGTEMLKKALPSVSKEITQVLDIRLRFVDLVGYLLDNHGAEINGKLKSLQIVASLTSERDGELRKAALNSLAIGYKILGDDIWKYVGKLTEAQRSMIDDRFKWKAREMDKRNEGKPGEVRAALRRFVRENGLARLLTLV